MQMNGSVAALLMVLMGAQVPSPPAKAPEPPTSATPAQSPKASPAAPYRKLFTQPQQSAPLASAHQALQERKQEMEGREPKIVCHMKVIPVDPHLDPKIVIAPRHEPNLTFHLRRIPAPACTE
jgi:hypothetical protein